MYGPGIASENLDTRETFTDIGATVPHCFGIEPAFAGAEKYARFQFVRQGFFCVDAKDSAPDALVFNRIVSLKSSFKLPK